MSLRSIALLLQLLGSLALISTYIVDPGPTVKATKGEVWPKPRFQESSPQFYIVRPQAFEFRVVHQNCKLLRNALQRYYRIINDTVIAHPHSAYSSQKRHYYKPWRTEENFAGYLDTLNIYLVEPCTDVELPKETMQEQYQLNITCDGRHNMLFAPSIWGILRGLETFSQLLQPTEEIALQINCTAINDYPRFSHRGLLVDTSRHFIPVPKILLTLDAMAYNKLNVFHWHITDDQSFPYQSVKFPQLSEKGAYAPSLVYSPLDVQKIIQYAGARGIRVVPEFDTPGHTRSWGEAFPELLTACYRNGAPSGQYGPIDPTKPSVYTFLQDFFDEVVKVFPDNYLHLGADEVEFECWNSNPDIIKFMQDNNFTNYISLEDFYIQRLLKVAENLKAKTIVWEEVFVNGVYLSNSTLVHVWRDYGLHDWKRTVYMATEAGLPVLLSACWYLDHLSSGGDWENFYQCEPLDFSGTDKQKRLLVGGEACMWSESVNEYNIISRVWPRACATAEKLWSSQDADTVNHAARRLEEHTCRLNKRGIGAQPPNRAGFCP